MRNEYYKVMARMRMKYRQARSLKALGLEQADKALQKIRKE